MRLVCPVSFAILTLASCSALHADQLDTVSNNFLLANGGGGASATLNNSLNIEIFNVDFANDIIVPHNNYSANLTALTSFGFTAGTARFGNNTSWRTVTLSDDATDGGSDDAADSAIINAANALGRYQMAAYLVSQYNLAGGGNAANNGIQTAIWELLDPSSYVLAPFSADPSSALEQAAIWFSLTSTAARDSYLMDYRIVSDTTMQACGVVACGGFQEQITASVTVTPVPEPKSAYLLLMVLFAVLATGFHKRRSASRMIGCSRQI